MIKDVVIHDELLGMAIVTFVCIVANTHAGGELF
jgi:hypothetical protein